MARSAGSGRMERGGFEPLLHRESVPEPQRLEILAGSRGRNTHRPRVPSHGWRRATGHSWWRRQAQLPPAALRRTRGYLAGLQQRGALGEAALNGERGLELQQLRLHAIPNTKQAHSIPPPLGTYLLRPTSTTSATPPPIPPPARPSSTACDGPLAPFPGHHKPPTPASFDLEHDSYNISIHTTAGKSTSPATMAQGDSERVREAQKLAKSDPQKAEQMYKEIISTPPSVTSEAAIKEYETALIGLGELYRDQK